MLLEPLDCCCTQRATIVTFYTSYAGPASRVTSSIISAPGREQLSVSSLAARMRVVTTSV